jgi:hypothetical protein
LDDVGRTQVVEPRWLGGARRTLRSVHGIKLVVVRSGAVSEWRFAAHERGSITTCHIS